MKLRSPLHAHILDALRTERHTIGEIRQALRKQGIFKPDQTLHNYAKTLVRHGKITYAKERYRAYYQLAQQESEQSA